MPQVWNLDSKKAPSQPMVCVRRFDQVGAFYLIPGHLSFPMH